MRSDVRWNPDEGWFELRCDSCVSANQGSAYWPLTVDEKGRPEFWDPRLALRRCRACHNTKRRLARRAAMDAREKQRAYYRVHREHRLEWVHAYRERRRDEINALRRAAYARRKAAQADG